ncbi:MAG TPA: protein kinase [Pyrinomonadaceae bacterium]|nr:protein kinase [Pyrinomonadaceae bacterium]
MDSTKRIGNYLIEEPIGRGGMGIVYRGRHEKLQRVVALKSISPRGTHDLRRMRHRFEREAIIQAQLDHPAIVKIYDYVVSEQAYFIIMEFVEGRSLAQLIASEQGALPVERALDLFEQILEAVEYAHTFVYRDEKGATHRGIVHRDLKPPNILVTPGDRVKITDFGIVKLVGAEATDTSNIAYGSPRYVSPEQAEGLQLDQRSDIYSLGVILYEMLTGEPPFGGRGAQKPMARSEILRAHVERTPRAPQELNPEITDAVERVVCRALEKKPERRFASAADFLRALRRARGRDTGDIAVAPGLDVTSRAVGDVTTGSVGDVTDEVAGDIYHTQPIRTAACSVCGEEAAPEDVTCRACGHDLSSSPATSELARQDATVRHGRHGLRLAAVSLLLLALLASIVFLIRRHNFDAAREEAALQANAAATPSASPAPAPSFGPVSRIETRVKVDSSFDGYGPKPLTDGVTDVRRIGAMRYNEGNWVSNEKPEEHWIELEFERPTRATAVYIFWGFDRERYMPSRTVELRAPDGAGGWRTVSKLDAGENYDRAAFEFEPFVAKALRIVQPPQQGPSNRPFVMWVREVEVFGNADAKP